MDDVAAPSPGRMVLSPKESPGFDPYAFPTDDQASVTGNSAHYQNSTPLQLSVHPKTFLPPGNPSTNMRVLPDKGLEHHPSHLPPFQHSPTQGTHPAAQTGQQLNHPTSKLQHDSLTPVADIVHTAKQSNLQADLMVQTAKQGNLQAAACQTSVFSQQTEAWQPQVPKKKGKQKGGEEGEEGKKKVKKPKKPKESAPSLADPGNSRPHTPGDVFPVGYTTQPLLSRSEPKVLCAKNAAPTLPASMSSKDSNTSHSSQSSGGFTPTSHTLPSTTSAATFTNSIPFYPEHRRQSTDSQELSSSRPASRTSTMSSASSSAEGRTKEPSDSVPMSKILEIIEREKLLGSSSPCKRRRTAKPQHIQEAEEEAKKFAAANAVQGIISGASPADKHHSNTNSQDGIKKSGHNSSSAKKPGQANCSAAGRKEPDAVGLREKAGDSPRLASAASSPSVQAVSQCSNDSSDSQTPHMVTPGISAIAPSSINATHAVVNKSDTPGPNKSAPLFHPQVFNQQPEVRATTSSRVPSDISTLPASGVAPNTVTYALSVDTSVEKPVPSFQGGSLSPFHGGSLLPQNSSVPPAQGSCTKVNGSLISPPQRENTRTITPQPPQHTGSSGKPTEQPFLPDALVNLKQFGVNHTAFEEAPKQQPFPPASPASKDNFKPVEMNSVAVEQRTAKDRPFAPVTAATVGNFQQFEMNRAALEEKMAKERILKDLSASHIPASLRSGGDGGAGGVGGLSQLQSTIQGLLHGSSPTPQWVNGSLGNNGSLDGSLPSMGSTSPALESAMDVKVQDLEPSLTCDLNSAWSQTANMISGIDPQQPFPPPANSTVQNPVAKKPKKKRSVNKPKAQQVSTSTDTSLPDNALPPFGAFAGLKTEPVHAAFGSVPCAAYPQHLNSQANHTTINTGLSSPGTKKKVKKSAVNQIQTSLEGMDRKLLKGSPELQEPLRDNSNVKTLGSTEFFSSGDSCTKSMKPPPNMNNQSFKADVHNVTNARQMFHSSSTQSTEKIDLNGSKPFSDYHADFKTGSNGIIQQKTVMTNMAVNTKPENFPGHFSRLPQQHDDNSFKAALNGFKTMAEDSVKTHVRSQPVSDGWQKRTGMENLGHPESNWSPNSGRTFVTQSGVVQSSSPGLPSPQSRVGAVNSGGLSGTHGGLGSQARAGLAPQGSSMPQNNAPGRVSGFVQSGATVPCTTVQSPNGIGLPRPSDTFDKKPRVGIGVNAAESKPGSTVPGSVNQSSKLPPFSSPTLEPGIAHLSPEEELDDRLRNNRVESAPKCNCLGPNYEFNESIEGPYYTQLGAAKDVPGIRRVMEKRTGLSGNAIRIEKIHFTGKEGRSSEGCPIAKWIIRRSGPEEKYLCVARKRPGHFCDTAFLIVVIVAWEGVDNQQADSLYGYLVSTLTKNGFETDRRCATNERKTCACQGVDLIRRGASFSFGCSWSMYFNGCKFARSHIARKFKLKDTHEEEKIEEHLQELATKVAPLYKAAAPDAYRNQTFFEEQAGMCRLGNEKGKPFSGVTACVDFCAHSHKDLHNMQNGSTVVVTLTKHRGWSRPDDEQLHVLPLYVMDNTDENGSIEGQMRKVQGGALEILQKYSLQARMRATPLKKPKRGAKKESPAKVNAGANTPAGFGSASAPSTPTPPMTPTKERDLSFLHSQDSSQSWPEGSLSGSGDSAVQTPEKRPDSSNCSLEDRDNSQTSDDFMSQSFAPSELYEKVWEYYYTNGAFPPQSYMDKWVAAQKQAMMNPQTNNGANQGSNMNKHHQPSSQPTPPQAAKDLSPSHFPPGAQHHGNPPHITPGIKTEAANSSDVDQEVINLTHKQDHSDSSSSPSLSRPSRPQSGNAEGSSSRSSEGHTPSRPLSVSADGSRPGGTRYASPLDLLTEAAASMEASMMSPNYASTPLNAHSRPSSRSSVPPSLSSPSPSPDLGSPTLPRPHSSPSVQHHHSHPGSPYVSPKPSCDAPPSCNDGPTQGKPVMPPSPQQQQQHPNGPFVAPTLGQGPDEPTFTMMDPTVVRCEWQDNTENFHDPGIGGVAIALTHGAVLFEVAKRELHATTALKNPNRYQPTRISLVFYQHKNLNFYHHGYYEYERKLATQRKKRIEKLMEEGATAEEAEKAVKPGRKRKKKEAEGEEEEEEKIDFAKTSAAQYRYMWDTTVRHGMTLTTDSIITRWIDPQPMVTGPYQRWV